jgi:recombinational DNA repair ATPase RecF
LREALFGITPVLLFDDVSSELDRPHATHASSSFLAAFDGQTFITTTDLAFLPFETDRQVFRVEAGRITPE